MPSVPQLHYYPLGAEVTAFSSTRAGGVSQGQFAEFNINGYCGDDPVAVAANRESLCRVLDLSISDLVMPHQVHGTEILRIDSDFRLLPASNRQSLLEGKDALITNVPRLCIGVSTADCIPVLLFDPERLAVGAVHAGWRGTVASIVLKTVGQMRLHFGSEAGNLRAVIGPGISLRHFEVGDEVYTAFREAGFEMSRLAQRYEKWHIDLWECNRQQLLMAGVAEENIMVLGSCTYADNEKWFSARRQGVHSGRIFSGIFLR